MSWVLRVVDAATGRGLARFVALAIVGLPLLLGPAVAAPAVEPEDEALALDAVGYALRRAGAVEAGAWVDCQVAIELVGSDVGVAALRRLLDHAESTGDFVHVDLLLPVIGDDAWPPEAQDRVRYRRAVGELEVGADASALGRLREIPEASEDYTLARLLMGVAYAHDGRLKSSVRAFSDVVRTKRVVDTEAKLVRANWTRDLALLDIARIYYSIGRYPDALTYVAYIERASPVWRRAQVEGAWSELRLGRTPLPRISLLGEHADLPEVDLVIGLQALAVCDLRAAADAAGRLNAAVARDLGRVGAALREAPSLTWAAWCNNPSSVGALLRARFVSDRELSAIRWRRSRLAEEQAIVPRAANASSLSLMDLTALYESAWAETDAAGASRVVDLLLHEQRMLTELNDRASWLTDQVAREQEGGACTPL